jgi:probable F420-dependent oxidoreductase
MFFVLELRQMKFALYGLHRGSSVQPEKLRARAHRAEAAGFEALWVGDHIALPADAPDPATEPRLEALTALTFLAATTNSVRLGVGVLVLPQRQPVLLAKQLTSLDVLSGGRLTVGVGVGYVQAELRALGASLAGRAAMTDEFLDALGALWAGTPEAFDGQWVSFAGVVQAPRPIQRPSPPIIVGGHTRAAIRRAVRVGSGWFGWNLDLDETTRAVSAVHAACRDAGRDPHSFEITITPPMAMTKDLVAEYARRDVDRLVMLPSAFDGSEIDDLIEYGGSELIGREPRRDD